VTADPKSGFQYPILRIVGCKCEIVIADDGLPPAFSILSCGSSVASWPRLWQADRRRGGAFSILSCGSSVARGPGGKIASRYDDFQYPILRIVGCKSAYRTSPAARQRPFSILSCGSSVASCLGATGLQSPTFPFSILSCGSSVASEAPPSATPSPQPSFSILSCGSSVASVLNLHGGGAVGGLSVSYPADRRLQEAAG